MRDKNTSRKSNWVSANIVPNRRGMSPFAPNWYT
jgi:hypothetical protein